MDEINFSIERSVALDLLREAGRGDGSVSLELMDDTLGALTFQINGVLVGGSEYPPTLRIDSSGQWSMRATAQVVTGKW